MSERINTDLVLDAITMACWRRKPKAEVLVHSDQGCQYTSYDWRSMLEANNSTRRHGNNNDLSPMEYEKNYFLKKLSV